MQNYFLLLFCCLALQSCIQKAPSKEEEPQLTTFIDSARQLLVEEQYLPSADSIVKIRKQSFLDNKLEQTYYRQITLKKFLDNDDVLITNQRSFSIDSIKTDSSTSYTYTGTLTYSRQIVNKPSTQHTELIATLISDKARSYETARIALRQAIQHLEQLYSDQSSRNRPLLAPASTSNYARIMGTHTLANSSFNYYFVAQQDPSFEQTDELFWSNQRKDYLVEEANLLTIGEEHYQVSFQLQVNQPATALNLLDF